MPAPLRHAQRALRRRSGAVPYTATRPTRRPPRRRAGRPHVRGRLAAPRAPRERRVAPWSTVSPRHAPTLTHRLGFRSRGTPNMTSAPPWGEVGRRRVRLSRQSPHRRLVADVAARRDPAGPSPANWTTQTSPAALAPLLQVRALRTEGGVEAVARVDPGLVRQDVEELATTSSIQGREALAALRGVADARPGTGESPVKRCGAPSGSS